MNPQRRDPKKHPVARSVMCYFCNENFEEKYLQDHVTQCGSVLEPCPKKCGVYVLRNSKEKHIMECNYKKPRPRSSHDFLDTANYKQPLVNQTIEHLETEVASVRSTLAEERLYRLELQVEVQRLQKLYMKSEEYNKQLSASLETLKRSWFEEIEKRKSFMSQQNLEMDKVNLQYQVLDGWRKQVEGDNKSLEFSVKNLESRLVILDRLEMEMNMLHQKVNDEQFTRQEETIACRGELNEFKNFFAQENAMIGALWTEQKDEIEALKQVVEVQGNGLSDVKTKYHSIVFETKSVGQTAAESEDKLGFQESELKNMKQILEQLKQDFRILEKSAENHCGTFLSNGRLLWKIDNFKEKMDNAKNHNTVLYSPIFYSSLNGYKLRLEIYLNGIKKWRGRHIIMSLQVLKGEWDLLLSWPCIIEAKVLLRDQNDHQAKNFMKYITAKRRIGDEESEDPQESSSEYIFITHATLDKQSFIKDNIMFFEIIIISDNLSADKKPTTDVTTL